MSLTGALFCMVQDSGAMQKLLSLLLTASWADEDYGEACWALLGEVARFMRSFELPQEVLMIAAWHELQE